MAGFQLRLQDNNGKWVARKVMQILSIEHLYEVLDRAVELKLPKEFIDLVVIEINNKR